MFPAMRFTGSFVLLAMILAASTGFERLRARGREVPPAIPYIGATGPLGLLVLAAIGGVP